MTIRTYSEMMEIPDFLGRFNYLKLNGIVGEMNLDVNRYLNQYFYHTYEWRKLRSQIMIRDDGFDLGVPGYVISGRPIVHHINPITVEDVMKRNKCLFDPENLILVSHETHNGLHYGDESIVKAKEFPIRTPNDTCLWKSS